MNNAESVQRFFDFYTAHDVKAMLLLYSPTAMFRYIPLGENGTGSVHRAASSLWQSYIDAFPNFSTKIIRLIESKRGEIIC